MKCNAVILVLSISISAVLSIQDDYINEAQMSCHKSRDTYSCFKYRALKYVSGMAGGTAWPLKTSPWNSVNDSSRSFDSEEERILRIARIDDASSVEDDDQEVIEESRQLKGDSEMEKLIKFGRRQLGEFLKKHGIRLELPEGARASRDDEEVLDENEITRSIDSKTSVGRGKKKKLSIFLPLLSLLGIFKIKLLLVPIMLTILFIKKIIVLAALFLPSMLASLKICKLPHTQGHGQFTTAEVNPEYSAAYSPYVSATNGGYGKEWAASRAYGGHSQNAEQSFAKQTNAGFESASGNMFTPYSHS